jgi:hypothetical protein
MFCLAGSILRSKDLFQERQLVLIATALIRSATSLLLLIPTLGILFYHISNILLATESF